jgi:cell pole-organizing protein PopZ
VNVRERIRRVRGLVALRSVMPPGAAKLQESVRAMTAYPSAIPESTAAEQRAHEPSMEEILASIRKIISEDQSMPLSPRPELEALREESQAPRHELQAPRDEVMPPPVEDRAPREANRPPLAREPEVERMRPPAITRPPVDFSTAFSSPPPPRPVRPEPARLSHDRPVSHRPSADVREIGARPQGPTPRLVATTDDEPLLSDQTDMAVNSSFQVLSVARSIPSPQAIESVARDLLRPMLKEWLDDNLPALVERLVRAEIERVTRAR